MNMFDEAVYNSILSSFKVPKKKFDEREERVVKFAYEMQKLAGGSFFLPVKAIGREFRMKPKEVTAVLQKMRQAKYIDFNEGAFMWGKSKVLKWVKK